MPFICVSSLPVRLGCAPTCPNYLPILTSLTTLAGPVARGGEGDREGAEAHSGTRSSSVSILASNPFMAVRSASLPFSTSCAVRSTRGPALVGKSRGRNATVRAAEVCSLVRVERSSRREVRSAAPSESRYCLFVLMDEWIPSGLGFSAVTRAQWSRLMGVDRDA